MLHNALTNYARLLTGVRRILGEMSPEFTGVERAGETLQPVFDPFSQPEWAILRGETIFTRRPFQAAVAARFSAFEFVNPTGSGIIAIVDMLENTGGQRLQLGVDTGPAIGAGPSVVGGVANDTRQVAGEASRVRITQGDLAAGVSNLQWILQVNDQLLVPFIVTPGSKLFLIGETANTAVECNFLWRERPQLDTEVNR